MNSSSDSFKEFFAKSNEDRLQIYEVIIHYLDETGAFEYIREKCQTYSRTQDKIFEFAVKVSCLDLAELNADLGNWTLNNPLFAQQLFQQVIYNAVESLGLLSSCQYVSQIAVHFKLTDLPAHDEYRLRTATGIGHHKTFVQYDGVLIGLSVMHKYTKSARFICPTQSCPGGVGERFIRLHIPGARETQTVRDDFKCTFCRSVLVEDVSSRMLAEKTLAEFIDEKALCEIPQQRRYQSLLACFRDEMASNLSLGQRMTIVGLPVYDSVSMAHMLEVNNILSVEDSACTVGRCLGALSSLPPSVVHLFNENRNSPWSFVRNMAFHFAACVTPAGTYFNLKLTLLLSLLCQNSQSSQCKHFLDVLAVGTDTLLLQRIINYSALFARRCCQHSVTHNITATISKDRSQTELPSVEAGSLLLARGGVCIIPDLSLVSTSSVESLMYVFETDQIPISGRLPVQQSHPIQRAFSSSAARRCTVWSAVASTGQKHGYQFFETSGGNDFSELLFSRSVQAARGSGGGGGEKSLFAMLVSMFRLVCMTESKSDSATEQLLVNSTISSATTSFSKPSHCLNEDDFKTFVQHASALSATLSSEAQQLIQRYYVTSRRCRTSDNHKMPINAIKTITSLSESVAKLNLRSEVAVSDAVLAIHLYEETLLQQTGFSPLNVRSVVHATNTHVISQFSDGQLMDFHKRLVNYLTINKADSFCGNVEE